MSCFCHVFLNKRILYITSVWDRDVEFDNPNSVCAGWFRWRPLKLALGSYPARHYSRKGAWPGSHLVWSSIALHSYANECHFSLLVSTCSEAVVECFSNFTWTETEQRIAGLVPKTIAPFGSDKLVGNDAAGRWAQQSVGKRILGQHSSEKVQVRRIAVALSTHSFTFLGFEKNKGLH